MNTTRMIIVGLIVLTILRIVIGASYELSPDEAYYYWWSQHWDWSYYSKGPGIASALKFSTGIFGPTSLGIRILSPLLALGSSFLLYRLARSLYNDHVAGIAVVVLNLLPIFNVGSIVMTIDPLSIFFWIAAMLAFWRALHRASRFSPWWILTGLLIGLGFLAKYTNALLLLSILLLLIVQRRWRRHLINPGFYLMLFTFLLCTLPVIWWNYQNDWITVTHLGERGKLDESTGIHITEFLQYLAVHFGVYSPVIFVGLLWALIVGIRKFTKEIPDTFLLCMSLPIILIYFLLAWREAGEANWTAPGFIPVAILLAHYWHQREMTRKRKSTIEKLALGVAAVLTVLTLNLDMLRNIGVQWPYARDPGTRLRGWKETSSSVADVIRASREALGEDVFLIANKYQTASVLSFYLPKDLPVIQPSPEYPRVHMIEAKIMQNQYSFWPRYDELSAPETPDKNGDLIATSPFLGKTAMFITDYDKKRAAPEKILKAFEQTEITAIIDIKRRNMPMRRMRVYTCYSYRGLSD